MASHAWSQVYSDSTGATQNAAGTGAIQFTHNANVGTASDYTYTSQSKDSADISSWGWSLGKPNAKSEIADAFGAVYQGGGYSDFGGTHTLLYVGGDRVDTSSASDTLGVWFLQTPIALNDPNLTSGNFVNKGSNYVTSATIPSGGGGTGYSVGDVLQLVGGTGLGGAPASATVPARFKVTSVNTTTGAVTGISLLNTATTSLGSSVDGQYTVVPLNGTFSLVNTTHPQGGSTGLKLNLAWSGVAAHHQVGDTLFAANFSSTTSYVEYVWNGTTIPTTGTPLPSTTGIAQSNSGSGNTTIYGTPAPGALSGMPWPYKNNSGGSTVPLNDFLEEGVDMNELYQATNANLPNFSAFIVETRTSNSSTATLQSFILGNVSTAPDVAVTKTADVAATTSTTVAAGGSGYAVNDFLTLTGGTFTKAAQFKVTSIGAGGAVTGVSLVTAGAYSALPTNPVGTTDSGSGTGATLNLAWDGTPKSVTVNPGTQVGYTVAVSNVGVGDALGVTLTDPLPVGSGYDINWQIDTTTGNSSDFKIVSSGTIGTSSWSQTLTFDPSTFSGTIPFDSPALVVHVIGTPSATDGGGDLHNVATVSATNEGPSYTGNDKDAADIVLNLPVGPAVSESNTTAVEGASTSIPLGTFTSPLTGNFSVVVNWGDNSSTGPFTVNAASANTPITIPATNHTYSDENTYGVTVTVTDPKNQSGSGTFNVVVGDASLTGSSAASYSSTVYSSASLSSASFTDANPGDHTADFPLANVIIDWGDNSTSQATGVTYNSTTKAYTVAGSHTYNAVGTGSYSITISVADVGGSTTTITGTAMVAKANLSITANSTSKTYGQTVTFAGTEFTAIGLLNGDSVTGVTLNSTGAAATATVSGSPYPIVPSNAVGSGLGNYTITYANGSLTVNTASLTITASDQSKTYGTSLTLGTTAFTTTGLLNGDSVTGVTLNSTGAAATATVSGSPYLIVPSNAVSSGLGNYTITYANGNLTVNKAHLTVTANSDSFDEGTAPSGLTATISGFVNGETLATSGVSGSPTLTTNATGTSAPGSSYTITPSLGTLTASNYDFPAGNFINGTLTVVDVAPAIVLSTGPISISPGDGFTRPGNYTDPGSAVPTETWTLTINYGDNSPVSSSSATPGSISVGHPYQNPGQYTVNVTISDNYGASSQLSFTVNVATPPTLTLSHNVTPIGPTASASTGVAFGITGNFTDSTPTGSYSINWGDPAGNSNNNPNLQSGTVTGTSGTFNGSHTYKHKGTYTVYVTFTDAYGNNTTVSFALTVS
jgi:hypothetical protein